MGHHEALESVIDTLRKRITKVLPQQVRDCLDLLDEEQIWWRPNEQSNSVGNIVLHVTGSLNHYLNRNLGNIPYDRDRAAEFAERRHLPEEQLRAVFDDMVAKAEQTFDGITTEGLDEPSPEPKMHNLVIDDLMNIAVHLANHTGQIVWIAKMLRGDAIDEVWMRAHRAYAWPK